MEWRGKAQEANKELSDKLDTETDAELFSKYDLDPSEMQEKFAGQSPTAG